MNRSIQKTLLVTGLGLALLSTGCMTSPGNGEYVGHRAEPVEFGGFVMEPSELIRIDARHPTLGWRTIGWTRSERHAYNWNGQQWYPWQRTLRVPSIYWDSLGYGLYRADIRAVQHATDGTLATFQGEFGTWFEPGETLGQMWADHGHGTSVEIYAHN